MIERGNRGNQGYLFQSQKSDSISTSAVWRLIKKYAKKADIADITPHQFRHTCATKLVRENKIDIVTVAGILGHSNIQTTSRYTMPSMQDMEDALNKLQY